MKQLFAAAIFWVLAATGVQAQTSWPAGCIQPIAFGQAISRTLTIRDCALVIDTDVYYTHVYSFTAAAGQRISITMNSTFVDSWLDLYDVNDVTVASLVTDDDGGEVPPNARIPAGSGYFTLPASGTYYIWASTALVEEVGAYTLTLSAGPTAVEFRHPAFDHYFITAYPEEAASLAVGNLPPWVPTGNTFNVWDAAGTNITNVCRWFSRAFAPKSGHFYSNNKAECPGLEAGGVWDLEATNAFYMMPSPTGTCPPGTTALYRLYNNGQGGAPNHRYTIDPAVRTSMIAANWIPEGNGADGVFACVPV
jgi:hypothetical protein